MQSHLSVCVCWKDKRCTRRTKHGVSPEEKFASALNASVSCIYCAWASPRQQLSNSRGAHTRSIFGRDEHQTKPSAVHVNIRFKLNSWEILSTKHVTSLNDKWQVWLYVALNHLDHAISSDQRNPRLICTITQSIKIPRSSPQTRTAVSFIQHPSTHRTINFQSL